MKVKAVPDLNKEEKLKEALRRNEGGSDRKAMILDCYQLGVLCQEAGRLPEAEALYRRSLVLCESIRDRSGVAAAYSRLGLLYEMYGDIGQARFFLEEARGTHRAINDVRGLPTEIVFPGHELDRR